MNNNKEIYSHFLQKALVKNFARMGKVKWMQYPNGKIGNFNINTNNSKQPIARKGYYSSHIEIGMSNLENEGINVIRKIAKNAQFKKEISLSRRELITLKCYSLLSSTRTQN